MLSPAIPAFDPPVANTAVCPRQARLDDNRTQHASSQNQDESAAKRVEGTNTSGLAWFMLLLCGKAVVTLPTL